MLEIAGSEKGERGWRYGNINHDEGRSGVCRHGMTICGTDKNQISGLEGYGVIIYMMKGIAFFNPKQFGKVL